MAGSINDRTVKIWDAQSGRELHTLGAKSARLSPLSRLAFSPDSKRLAGGGKIWDAETGQELANLGRGAEGTIDSVAFSPDGKRVAGGSMGTVSDTQTGKQVFTIRARGTMNGHPWMSFSPDGKRIASSAGIWDAQTGQELLSFGKEISGQVAFSPDGHRLAVVPFFNNTVTIYDATPLPEKP